MYGSKRLGFEYSPSTGLQPLYWYPSGKFPRVCVEPVYADGMKWPQYFVKIFRIHFLVPDFPYLVRRLARRALNKLWPFVVVDGRRYRVLYGPDQAGGVWVDDPDDTDAPVYFDLACRSAKGPRHEGRISYDRS